MRGRLNDLPGSADPEIIAEYERLREEDVKDCPICAQEGMKPRHFLPHNILETDGGLQLIVPTGEMCGGYGRRFDVPTKQFVGNSHCTCDSCW